MDKMKHAFTSVRNTINDMINGNTSLSDLPDIERSISNLSVTLGALYDAQKGSS